MLVAKSDRALAISSREADDIRILALGVAIALSDMGGLKVGLRRPQTFPVLRSFVSYGLRTERSTLLVRSDINLRKAIQ